MTTHELTNRETSNNELRRKEKKKIIKRLRDEENVLDRRTSQLNNKRK